MARVVIGTRGSPLALWQARHVTELLRARHRDLEVEERVIATQGDIDLRTSIPGLGETGVFVRRIEQALLAGEIDLAVHSLKDLPSDQPTGLLIGAVPKRHDARDALVTRQGFTLDDLPRGARVGTGSPRRSCQLKHARPDIEIVPIRGNVATRIEHVRDGRCVAVVLALAALERLEVRDVAIQPLSVETCVPAVGQGALAIEARVDAPATASLVEALSHPASTTCVSAERAFLRALGGGCHAPAAAHATLEAGRIRVEAVVGEPDGRSLLLEREVADASDASAVGGRLAKRLLVAGARRILEQSRQVD